MFGRNATGPNDRRRIAGPPDDCRRRRLCAHFVGVPRAGPRLQLVLLRCRSRDFKRVGDRGAPGTSSASYGEGRSSNHDRRRPCSWPLFWLSPHPTPAWSRQPTTFEKAPPDHSLLAPDMAVVIVGREVPRVSAAVDGEAGGRLRTRAWRFHSVFLLER
jgi:hypothetical protein